MTRKFVYEGEHANKMYWIPRCLRRKMDMGSALFMAGVDGPLFVGRFLDMDPEFSLFKEK